MEAKTRISFLVGTAALAVLTLAGSLAAPASDTVRTHTVVIEGMKFTPARLQITLGDRVVFENKDFLPHTATAKEPKTFDSGLIKAGESWTHQPATAQTIRYVCLFHPTMEGQIVIARR